MLKLKINRQKILSTFQLESRGANQQADLPILGSILITAEGSDSKVKFVSTNLSQAILSSISAEITSEGSVAVPARIVTDFLASLNEDVVELEELPNLKLKLSTKNHTSTIFLLNAEDFPSIPSVSDKTKLTISSSELKEILSKVSFCVSKDDTRPVLGGVFLLTQEDFIHFAATDGYRLSEHTYKPTQKLSLSSGLIIPTNTIQDLLKILSTQDSDDQIEVLVEDDQISFKTKEVTLISRLVSGDYPAYQNLIPASSDINLTVDREELLQAVKLSALFARESAGTISLQVDKEDQTLTINSVANQVGENHSQISVSTDETGSVNLNSRYLIEALNSFSTDLLNIRFSKGLAPFVITPHQDKKSLTHQHIIMPMNT